MIKWLWLKLQAYIDAHKTEDELLSFDDLRGIAPDATGDMSSEEFIRELRNGWQ